MTAFTTASPSPPRTPQLGEALPAVERPDPSVCDRLQRHDTLAARNIRNGTGFGGTGIDPSEAAQAAAEADPGADIDLLGIPLRRQEVGQLRKVGMHLDERSPIAFWVNEGRADLFGGIWIDPPGSGHAVVSVVDGDPDAIRLARCLERDDLAVRYVMATHSLEELKAIQDRLATDWNELEDLGISFVSAGQDSESNRISIEVEELTAEEAAILTERYGDGISLVSVPAPTPDVPLKLGQVPLALGTDILFDEAHNDGRQGDRGTWELAGGRLADDELHLRVSIHPPSHGLPATSGPAVLFAGMEVYGGSGDVGYGEPMDALASVPLPACSDADCTYDAEVILPTAEIMPAVRRLERIGEVSWIAVNLTLVRTFADGTWLQVLPLAHGNNSESDAVVGRLGEIGQGDGTIFPFGLFPARQATPIPRGGEWMFTTGFDYARAVEKARERLGDDSRRLTMASGALHVEIEPACQNGAHLTLHDDAGDRVFDADVNGKRVLDAPFAIPVDTDWRLTLHDGGGIDFDQGRQGWGIRAGEIRSDGAAFTVDATFSCVALTGAVEVAEHR